MIYESRSLRVNDADWLLFLYRSWTDAETEEKKKRTLLKHHC